MTIQYNPLEMSNNLRKNSGAIPGYRPGKPTTDYIKRVIIIQAAIPSAVIPVILAKRFGGHPDLGTQILLTTTVASFLTLPCWLALGSTLVVPFY